MHSSQTAGGKHETRRTTVVCSNSLSVFVFWILASCFAGACAQAQALLGEINGNVVDATQAAIVGARVVATNPDTNFSRQTTTNSVGWVYSC